MFTLSQSFTILMQRLKFYYLDYLSWDYLIYSLVFYCIYDIYTIKNAIRIAYKNARIDLKRQRVFCKQLSKDYNNLIDEFDSRGVFIEQLNERVRFLESLLPEHVYSEPLIERDRARENAQSTLKNLRQEVNKL